MHPNQQFADLLKHLLDSRCLNAAQLAKRLGIHRSNPSRWLSGEILPDRETVRRIADLLMLCGGERREFLLVWMGECGSLQNR
jgi:transcriptional regulator with XRE-family HTH domain